MGFNSKLKIIFRDFRKGCMRFNSKDFRQNNYFVLYDLEDNLICYFDNFEELSKYTSRPLKKIVFAFNQLCDYIRITIDNREYKLYTFF